MSKSFLFNSGFSGSTGLSLDFTRGYATVGDDGNAVTPDERRYTRAQRLLCGTPVVTQHFSSGSLSNQNYACAGGFSYDGTTPLFVHWNAPAATLSIHEGSYGTTLESRLL